MSQELRPYQAEAVEALRGKVRAGFKSAVLVAPTGAGKTTIAADIINGAVRRGNRIIFMAHRKELIDQCSARLDAHGIDHGIIKAGNKRRNSLPVQVASVQTLVNRVKPKSGQEALWTCPYPADLFIIDECHRAQATSYKKCLEAYPNAFVLGLTATPFRTDGRGLGDLFQTLVQVSTPAELTRMGFLVPARVFTTPMLPDFSQLKHKGGEFDQEAVELVMDKAALIGDIYVHWKKHAADRKTVIFASSRRHASNILDQFASRGEAIAYVDGETEEAVRDSRLRDLAQGRLRVIVNVGILTEGWDCPDVSCVVLARPTESAGLYLQMAGRALRPAPGKSDCIILDHGGNTLRHGFVTDEREYDLQGKGKGATDTSSVTVCQECFAVHNMPACPACGHVNVRKAGTTGEREDPEQQDGELQEINQDVIRQLEIAFFREALTDQIRFGFKPGYSKAKFFEKFGRWPGKEIGLKMLWEHYEEREGRRSYGKPAGYVFEGVEVRASDTIRHPPGIRSVAVPPHMENEHRQGLRV